MTMEQKRLNFANGSASSQQEEDKKSRQTSARDHRAVYEALHINVMKPCMTNKWVEYRIGTQLPERRSNMCSCIFNDK
jgi:hypothetical protein